MKELFQLKLKSFQSISPRIHKKELVQFLDQTQPQNYAAFYMLHKICLVKEGLQNDHLQEV